MVARYRQQLEHVLSTDRLAAYAAKNDDDLITVTQYFWNIALCQAFYPCLGSLEVAVRNSIHETLKTHCSQEDWYDIPGLLQSREMTKIYAAKRNVRDTNKQIIPGRVIAALSFGFWTSLLDGLYGNSPKGPQIWRSPNSSLLMTAFPHASSQAMGVPGPIFSRLDDIRRLRNRVFHYERICHGIILPSRQKKQSPRTIPIEQIHVDVMETIGWISPDLQATAVYLDTFTKVHQNGFVATEQQIKRYIGIP